MLVALAKSHMNGQIFNEQNEKLNRDNCLEPFIELKNTFNRYGIDIQTADLGDGDSAEKILFFDLTKENKDYLKYCVRRGWQKKMILVLWEGPVVLKDNWDLRYHQFFDKVLTWNDDYVDNKKYFKMNWPQTRFISSKKQVPFYEKRLCTMIAANKSITGIGELYSERIKAIKYFEENTSEVFDLYGIGWNNPTTILQKIFPILVPQYASYKGMVAKKVDIYSQYKFAICYENMEGVKGYVTEKIFDCFKGGCVPIYLGASNITEYVPEGTFIDKRNYKNYETLLGDLVSCDERRYNQYLEKIDQFLRSKKHELFSTSAFSDLMLQHVR